MSMVGFPLLLIPLAIYNMIVFLMPGVEFDPPLLRLRLVSGEVWPASLGDILVALGIVLLLLEVIKSARGKFLTDHLLSFLVFGGAAAEFVMWPKFANSTFFLLALLAMVEFFSGIALRAKRAARARAAVAAPAVAPAPVPEPAPVAKPHVEAAPAREPVPAAPEPAPATAAPAPAPAPVVTEPAPVPPAATVAESVLLDHPAPAHAPHPAPAPQPAPAAAEPSPKVEEAEEHATATTPAPSETPDHTEPSKP
ncbi:hypothetical protein [Bradyrhizobium sp. STM 3557]|uniref:hypothetical protein n=1 Tax=Bradyrhizobium sp. STM 3557 TaxID=578920 RepID=UPI00388FBDB6